MHPAATSCRVFGIYAVLTGLGLFVAPGPLLASFGLPDPTEIWVRVLGVLAVVVGYYYWTSARAGLTAFFRASVHGRLAFFVACVVLVAVVHAPVQLLVFGVLDLAGAVWTAIALRR